MASKLVQTQPPILIILFLHQHMNPTLQASPSTRHTGAPPFFITFKKIECERALQLPIALQEFNCQKIQEWPVYNHDWKPYTPGFTLQMDRRNTHRYDGVYRRNFQELKRHKQSGEIEDMAQPKRANFCQVCHEKINAYVPHILHPTHKEKLRVSNYSRHIKNLCRSYKTKLIEKEQIGRVSKKGKLKQMKMEGDGLISGDIDGREVTSN